MEQKKKYSETTEHKLDGDNANHVIKKISEGRFMVASAAAGASGDAACACSLPGGRLAFILSDGMGKGMKAAAESQAVVANLKRLLKKGVAPSKAIKLVNKELLKNGDSEIFATVDLIIIDKETGDSRFYKMGAATSFLLRDKNIKRIEHAALPIGMIGRISACQLKMKLVPGDTIIMVSDGITEADREDLEADWLQKYLGQIPCAKGPRILAGEIVSLAQEKYDERQKDDLTAVVIRIS